MTTDMTLVASSSIAAIGYDPERRELRVRFRRTGETYLYRDVEAAVFAGFLQAQSKGDYFNQVVQGRFTHSLL